MCMYVPLDAKQRTRGYLSEAELGMLHFKINLLWFLLFLGRQIAFVIAPVMEQVSCSLHYYHVHSHCEEKKKTEKYSLVLLCGLCECTQVG